MNPDPTKLPDMDCLRCQPVNTKSLMSGTSIDYCEVNCRASFHLFAMPSVWSGRLAACLGIDVNKLSGDFQSSYLGPRSMPCRLS